MHTTWAFERFEAAPGPGSSLSHATRAQQRFEAAPGPGSPLLHATRALRSHSAADGSWKRRGAAIFVPLARSRHDVRTNPRGPRAVAAWRASIPARKALLAFVSVGVGRGNGASRGIAAGRGNGASRGRVVGHGIGPEAGHEIGPAAGRGLGAGHGI